MITNQIKLFSKTIKHKSSRLLNNYQILKFLSEYWEVSINWSYSYDLMIAPDIDIYVIWIFNDRVIRDIYTKLMWNIKVNWYLFYDWKNYHKDGFPTWYYIWLKDYYEWYKWKIDIWFVKKIPPNTFDYKFFTKKQKELILLCKYYLYVNNIDYHSNKIYQLVQSKKINNIDDFVDLINVN